MFNKIFVGIKLYATTSKYCFDGKLCKIISFLANMFGILLFLVC